jgi:exonuclease VII small subunit
MPLGACDALQAAVGTIVTRIAEADAAFDAALQAYEQALQARDDALTAAALCGGNLPCVAAALYAAAMAELALGRYAEQARRLLEVIRTLEGLYERASQLAAHCQQLASWQTDAASELLAEGEGLADEAEGADIEDVDAAAIAALTIDLAAAVDSSNSSIDSDYG